MDDFAIPEAVFEFEFDASSCVTFRAFWSSYDDHAAPHVVLTIWSSRWKRLFVTYRFDVRLVRAEDGSPAVELRHDPSFRVDQAGWVERYLTRRHLRFDGAWLIAYYGLWSRGLLTQPARFETDYLPEVLHPTLDGWRFLTGAACPAVAVDEPNAV